MATAKRELTDPRVQGPRPTKDPLDKLIAIAMRVAQREGLLADVQDDSDTAGGAEPDRVGRRSA